MELVWDYFCSDDGVENTPSARLRLFAAVDTCWAALRGFGGLGHHVTNCSVLLLYEWQNQSLYSIVWFLVELIFVNFLTGEPGDGMVVVGVDILLREVAQEHQGWCAIPAAWRR